MSEKQMGLGDKVVVLENDSHPDLVGQEGVIEDLGSAFHFWVKIPANERGIQYGFDVDQLAPATEPQPADAPAVDGSPSVFDGIERRIMKAGDVRYLEGIDESMGIETARYINNHSIALHNANKVAEVFAQDAADLRAELDRVQAALQPFAKIAPTILKSERWRGNEDAAVYANDDGEITVGDFKRAAQALQASGDKG